VFDKACCGVQETKIIIFQFRKQTLLWLFPKGSLHFTYHKNCSTVVQIARASLITSLATAQEKYDSFQVLTGIQLERSVSKETVLRCAQENRNSIQSKFIS